MEYFIEVLKNNEIVGHQRITDKSASYIAGWTQAMRDKGYEVNFINVGGTA